MNTAQSLLVSLGFPQILLAQHLANSIQRFTKNTKRAHPNTRIRGIQRKMVADFIRSKEKQNGSES